MMSDLVEIGAAALKECRWDARKKNNAMLEKRGLWSDHTFQPSDAEYARALFAAIEKAGHRIVPFDPTDAMESAGIEQVDPTNPYKPDVASNVWFAMLAAAPKVTP